jgi:hypothetical protein
MSQRVVISGRFTRLMRYDFQRNAQVFVFVTLARLDHSLVTSLDGERNTISVVSTKKRPADMLTVPLYRIFGIRQIADC